MMKYFIAVILIKFEDRSVFSLPNFVSNLCERCGSFLLDCKGRKGFATGGKVNCINILAVLLLLLNGLSTQAQKPAKTESQNRDEVVKVATNLVQVDAIVTDKQGRPVTDLRPEDFELSENGRIRQITNFSYISLTGEQSTPRETNSSRTIKRDIRTSAPPLTLHAGHPEEVRRAIAILIDDFGLSFESFTRLRTALEKFIEEHTLPTDFIGVIRCSGGPGSMQQFTVNRTQIIAMIKRLRWYPTGRGGMSAFDSLSPIDNDENGIELRGYSNNRPMNLSSKEYFGWSLGALGFVIEGMSHFPGRKSIVLISDNLPVTNREAQVNGVTRVLDNLIRRANQFSIVISTMDARGLSKSGLTADDSQNNLAANQIDTRLRDRGIRNIVQQDPLQYIATQTGGVFIHDDNDLADGLQRIVDSEQGYYLLAYRPDDVDVSPEKARGRSYKVILRLKRPELELRTRSEFRRAMLPRDGAAPVRGKDDYLREALTSPFVREDVRLRMTAFFSGGAEFKILLHVNANDLEFVKSSDDTYQASFDMAAVAFDDNGKIATQLARSQTVRVPSAAYEQLLRDGFVYSVSVPIKLPGAYQLRLALRDSSSGRLGSDSQFVEVPDARKKQLTVSGFAVQRVDPFIGSDGTRNANYQTGRNPASGGPAVRRFNAGDLLTYSYLIYGERPPSGTGAPDLWSQIRLFRAGKEVFTGKETPVTTSQMSSSGGIVAVGTFRLGERLEPGEYFLQVIVIDKLAPAEKRISDQWIDFEIVK
jgi:VWFA-related protein